jgi:hypothetical protein
MTGVMAASLSPPSHSTRRLGSDVSTTNQGLMDNLLSARIKELIHKGMTIMIRDTNNVANSFN